jgi:hypothetical protein
MSVILLMILAFIGGCITVYFLLEKRTRSVESMKLAVDLQAKENRLLSHDLNERRIKLGEEITKHERDSVALSSDIAMYLIARKEFDARVVSYKECEEENKILKTDLRNAVMDVARQKVENEAAITLTGQNAQMCSKLGNEYLTDTKKWISSNLTVNNYAASKERLIKAIVKVRNIGVMIDVSTEKRSLMDLQLEYERVVRAAAEREEQARIRAQIREEALRDREAREAVERAEREQRIVAAALADALRNANNQHTAEVDRLERELAEAQAASQRAISQAQITKAGYVYVISNIGSFGEGVFKIGMTRRLEPLDRINELGDASVPFPFDVHLMISTTDAPKLENALHHAFHRTRLNKTNPRKEFFRTNVADIVEVVEKNHGTVEYTVDAEALQYRQSLTMTEEDMEVIEEAFEKAEARSVAAGIED